MPATVPYSSQGTKLQVSISSVYTDINQIKGLTGPSIDWDIADTTTLSSPSNYKEKFPLMKDPGTVSFDLVYDPANAAQEYLRASNAASAGVLEAFKEILSDPGQATIGFSGYVTKFEFKNESAQTGMAHVEITCSGAVTFTP